MGLQRLYVEAEKIAKKQKNDLWTRNCVNNNCIDNNSDDNNNNNIVMITIKFVIQKCLIQKNKCWVMKIKEIR